MAGSFGSSGGDDDVSDDDVSDPAVPQSSTTALALRAPRIKLIDFDHLQRAIETRVPFRFLR